jgi:hypothetical protein
MFNPTVIAPGAKVVLSLFCKTFALLKEGDVGEVIASVGDDVTVTFKGSNAVYKQKDLRPVDSVARVTFQYCTSSPPVSAVQNISAGMTLEIPKSSKTFYVRRHYSTDLFSLSTTLLGPELTEYDLQAALPKPLLPAITCTVTHRISPQVPPTFT